MKNIKTYAFCIALIFYLVAATLLEFPLCRSLAGDDVPWVDYIALALCGVCPAICIYFGVIDLELESITRQIIFSLLYFILAAIASVGIFIIIALIYYIVTEASFFEIAGSIFIIALVSAPTSRIILFITE